MDSASALNTCLEAPALIERAAYAVFLADGDGEDDWHSVSDEFRELYRSEVRLVLEAVRDASRPPLRIAA